MKKEHTLKKTTRGIKEHSKEQELKHENRQLRKENERLERENKQLRRSYAGTRKQFARMDLDRHSYVKDIIDEHLKDEAESIDSGKLLLEMKSKWRCHESSCSGHLEIVVYSKMGVPFYFRQCSECKNRTKGKTWHPGVEGPVKPIPDAPIKLGNSSKLRK